MSADFNLFKAVISDLYHNRAERPGTALIDFQYDDSESAPDVVKRFYCANPSQGRFIVTRFFLYRNEKAIVLEYENSTTESGGGAVVGYEYDDDNRVTYKRMFNMFQV